MTSPPSALLHRQARDREPDAADGLLRLAFGEARIAPARQRAERSGRRLSGASPTYALWGELMSTCALNRGAAGAVVNGWSRDTRGILALGSPVFPTVPTRATSDRAAR